MKKPANISSLIGGLAAAIGKVASFQDSHRKTQFRDHLTAIENGVAALGWVTAEKAPASFAKEQGEPAFMYTDRVLKNFKGKEEVHTQWARGFADFLKELPNYVKAHHTTGLTYAA